MSAGYDDMEELGKKPSTMDLVSATKYLKILNICLETEDGEFIEYVKTRTEQIFGRPIVDITAGYIMHRVDVKDQLLGGEWTLLNKINNIRIDKKKRILELQRIPHHTKSHSVQPSSKYPSHDMFDFGSTNEFQARTYATIYIPPYYIKTHRKALCIFKNDGIHYQKYFFMLKPIRTLKI